MWGLTHSLLYLPLFIIGENRQYTTNVVAENNWFPSIKELFQMGITFISTMIAWVFFRSESISDSFGYLISIMTKFSIPSQQLSGIIFVVILILFEWTLKDNVRNPINYRFKYLRRIVYLILVYLIIAHFELINKNQFIYFQF